MWYTMRRDIVVRNKTRKNACTFCKRGIDYVVLSTQSLESSEETAAFLVFPVAHFLLSIVGVGTRTSYVLWDYADPSARVHHLAHTKRNELG